VASPSRGQAVLLGAYVGRVVIGLALTAVLGRALSPDSFGFFTFVATIYLCAQSILDLGSGVLAVRTIVREPLRERPLLEGLMGWRLVAGFAMAGVVLTFAARQGDPDRMMVLRAAGASLLALAPGALAPAFQVRQAQGRPAFVTVLGQLLVLVGALVFHARGVNGVGFAWLLVVRELVSALLTWILAVRILGYSPAPGLGGRGLGEFLGPAAVFGAAVLAHDLYFYTDVFLVRLLRGEAQLGAYAAALRPLNPLLLLPSILMLPLLPVFSATALRNRGHLAAQVGGAAALVGGIGALGAAAGIALAPDLVQLLYGGRYLQGDLQAVTAFRWLCLALCATFTAAPFTTALLADGRERTLLALGTLGVLVNVGGNALLLPVYGFTAAAATTAATEALVGVGAVWAFGRVGGLPMLGLSPIAVLALAIGAIASTAALPGPGMPRIAAGAVVTTLGAFLLLSLPGARRFRQEIDRRPPEGERLDLGTS
jgi:O-antigen/teichoic acid export membrane protein